MPRLTSPNGSTVNVSDETAERLLAQGFKPVEEKKSAARKSSSSSKSE